MDRAIKLARTTFAAEAYNAISKVHLSLDYRVNHYIRDKVGEIS